MEKNSDEQFIIIKDAIEYNKQEMKPNKQDSDEKLMQSTETLKAEMKSNKQDCDDKMM